MPKSPTPTGTPRLSDLARHVVVPKGVTATGWPAVAAKCGELGIGFDPWQHGAGRIILAKRASAKYAASIGGVVLSIPRQVGKTYMIGAIIFALCLLSPNLTVIWTAHRLRTANETFRAMRAMAKRKKVVAFVEKVVLGSGEEEIQFRNGSRILFGARERGFGVGFAQVDVLVIDEAQRATTAALDDMVPTTNQSKQPAGPLLFFMGTPPRPTDSGEVFRQKRAEALSGADEDTAYIEFSADPGASPDDWAQVAKANPSYPQRTPREAILRMRKNLTDDSFLREGLGIWDPAETTAFDFEAWRKLADPEAARGTSPVFGVAVAPDRSWSAVAAAWRRSDGNIQVTLTEHGYRPEATWVAAHVNDLRQRAGSAQVYADQAARGLVEDAEEPSQAEQAQADNALADAVLAGTIRHGNDPAVDMSVRSARWKPSGDTRVLDRKGATDISPLRAVALALWGVDQNQSVYEERGMRFLG